MSRFSGRHITDRAPGFPRRHDRIRTRFDALDLIPEVARMVTPRLVDPYRQMWLAREAGRVAGLNAGTDAGFAEASRILSPKLAGTESTLALQAVERGRDRVLRPGDEVDLVSANVPPGVDYQLAKPYKYDTSDQGEE